MNEVRNIAGLFLPADIQTVLVDTDGTYFDSLSERIDDTNYVIKNLLGLDMTVSVADMRSFFGATPDEWWCEVIRLVQARQREPVVVDFVKVLEVNHERFASRESATCPGIHDAILAFRNAGLNLAIVSNRNVAQLQPVERVSNGSFDAYFGIDSVSGLKPKPDPSMILHAAKHFGVRPECCLLIEDSARGLTAGRLAGCYTLGVSTGELDFPSLIRLNMFGHVDDVIFSFAKPLPLDAILF